MQPGAGGIFDSRAKCLPGELGRSLVFAPRLGRRPGSPPCRFFRRRISTRVDFAQHDPGRGAGIIQRHCPGIADLDPSLTTVGRVPNEVECSPGTAGARWRLHPDRKSRQRCVEVRDVAGRRLALSQAADQRNSQLCLHGTPRLGTGRGQDDPLHPNVSRNWCYHTLRVPQYGIVYSYCRFPRSSRDRNRSYRTRQTERCERLLGRPVPQR
jgi:hypothetical protein